MAKRGRRSITGRPAASADHANDGRSAQSPADERDPTAILSGVLAAMIAAAAAGASEAVGLTHLTWLWAIVLSAAVGAVAFALTNAVQAKKKDGKAKLRWWQVSAGLMLAAIIVSFFYHRELDPSLRQPRTYQFVVNGNDTREIALYGEAGGQPQELEPGAPDKYDLIGGQSYSFFDCWVVDRNGNEWLRYERFGQSWWAPRQDLHPPFGESEPSVPHC